MHNWRITPEDLGEALRLLDHHNVGRDDAGAFELALKLLLEKRDAEEKRKGESRRRQHRPSALASYRDVFSFLCELGRCREELDRELGKKPSDARVIKAIMKTKFVRDRSIKESTIKGYLRQMRTISKVIKSGTCTDFQNTYRPVARVIWAGSAAETGKK